MAAKNGDQPGMYTMSQLKEIVGGNDVYTRVRMGKSSKGAIIRLPLVDPEDEHAHVDYIFDGKDLWHRQDTKLARVVRSSARRAVKNRG